MCVTLPLVFFPWSSKSAGTHHSHGVFLSAMGSTGPSTLGAVECAMGELRKVVAFRELSGALVTGRRH